MKKLITACLTLLACTAFAQQQPDPITINGNLAVIAKGTNSARQGAIITNLNDGFTPTPNRYTPPRNPQTPATQWVQYEWNQPVNTKEIATFWWNYNGAVKMPKAYRVQYWDGNAFVSVKNATGLGMQAKQFNTTIFDEVKTTKLRLEIDSTDRNVSTLQEWVVKKAPGAPDYSPVVTAGVDRDVMIGGKTYLAGAIKSVGSSPSFAWSKAEGPGTVTFSNAAAKSGEATFSAPGVYVLTLMGKDGTAASIS